MAPEKSRRPPMCEECRAVSLTIRPMFAAAALLLLAACDAERDLEDPLVPLGEFRLLQPIVVADNVQKVEPSRDVSPNLWESAMSEAITRRFGRYSGEDAYYIAVGVAGYSVAVTGIPLVLTPKSVVIIDVTVWDDVEGKLSPEPERFTILESFGEGTIIGSGATMTKEEQVAQLSANAAKRIETWMRQNEAWFAPKAPRTQAAE